MFDSEESKEGEEEEEPADVGPKEMTLDEYRAMQSSNPKNTGFNIRKAGEGVDDKQWKKMYVLKKKPTEENSDDEDEYEVSDHTSSTLALVFW